MLLKSQFYSNQIVVVVSIKFKYKLIQGKHKMNLVIKDMETIIMVKEVAIFIIKNSAIPNIKQTINKMR